MRDADRIAHIRARAERAGVMVDDELAMRLAAYLELVRRWNRRINLTAFDLERPSDAAIDRLVIESLEAAVYLGRQSDTCIDVGSGAGSPAIPLKLAVGALRLVLIEVRQKKSAFLREVVRVLALDRVDVATMTVQEYATDARHAATADIVTLRAVHMDAELWSDVAMLLVPEGRVLWFGGADLIADDAGAGTEELTVINRPPGIAKLAVLARDSQDQV